MRCEKTFQIASFEAENVRAIRSPLSILGAQLGAYHGGT